MIRKLFGSMDNSQPERLPERAHLERLLAEMALEIPQIDWLALVKSNGIFVGSFPSKTALEADRISAMSAAMASLGERIASELKNGDLLYTLIAGKDGISVAIDLGSRYLVTAGLKRDISIEGFLSYMQETGIPLLMQALQVEGTVRFSGIQQK